MDDNKWLNFLETGNVSDYLKYKEQERKQSDLTGLKDQNHGSFNKGFGDQGTDDRGE